MEFVILESVIITLVAIESFVIGLCLAAWYKARGELGYTPKWAKLNDLNEDQIEELKKFLLNLRSGKYGSQDNA